MTVSIDDAASFRVFLYRFLEWIAVGCQPRHGRNAENDYYDLSIIEQCGIRWTVRQINRQGSSASSRPVRHGESVAPAAQEQQTTDPQPDGSNDTGTWGQLVPMYSRVQRLCQQSPRRSKRHIVPFRTYAKANSLRCSSSPNRTRDAGLRFGCGITAEVIASVLHSY